MRRYRYVFEAIAREGNEASFAPIETDEFQPARLPAGSREKIELLRRGVEMGEPMQHDKDRTDYSELGSYPTVFESTTVDAGFPCQ